LEACLETAQRMRGLSQSLLELARFDSGEEPIQRERFDAAELARKCAELIKPLANERGIAIHTNLEPVEISGDAVRIEQVITNLLGNAVFYNKENGHIDLSLKSENGMAVLKVADTGQGINEVDMPHIFKRFYRADKSRTQANGRSGLGLAITKAIVDAHGGSIEVESPPGAGTTFIVRLPQ
jgi:two-component system, OmpR family, sensor kinase